MENEFQRTELLLGKAAMERLHTAHVAVFGIGGVGGHTAEALARSGVGHLDLVDHDTVSLSNINRQIFATHKTVGQYKVDVARERLTEINPNLKITTYKMFYLPETADQFDFTKYDYIVDAVDTVAAKLALAQRAAAAGVKIISCMGAGNKLDPSAFEVTDIFKTAVCPLAKTMRSELRKRGIRHLKVVYSKELPLKPIRDLSPGTPRRQIPGSTAFVPAVAGLMMAGEVICDLTGVRGNGIGI